MGLLRNYYGPARAKEHRQTGKFPLILLMISLSLRKPLMIAREQLGEIVLPSTSERGRTAGSWFGSVINGRTFACYGGKRDLIPNADRRSPQCF